MQYDFHKCIIAHFISSVKNKTEKNALITDKVKN